MRGICAVVVPTGDGPVAVPVSDFDGIIFRGSGRKYLLEILPDGIERLLSVFLLKMEWFIIWDPDVSGQVF